MGSSFNTSVNILRDSNRDFNYIPTPNAGQVVNQIVNDFKKGIRSFNIIGTYGTGKSSFLLALEQSLKGTKRYFDPKFTSNNPEVSFIKIVGSYDSLIEEFASILEIDTRHSNRNENIFAEIYNRYHSIKSSSKILFLVIDEFGKFLEYASKHNPENELYFIQQLAEFCNNPKYNIVLISTLHQSFESYAFSLSTNQKQEWAKVKGRFREITFNEPVEQLLFLASEYVGEHYKGKIPQLQVDKCLKLSVETKAFSFNKIFVDQIAAKIFPLDILSANILTLSLQRYGQNERSLFSFLGSTDHTGLSRFNKSENPFYNISNVYDYLTYNYYSILSSKYNPDFSSWSSIRSSLEVAERLFDTNVNDYAKAIKTIGLLNIFSANGAVLDEDFLSKYLETACGVSEAHSIIKNLEVNKVIRFRKYSRRYILFEGTDLDIQAALAEAGNKISEVSDVVLLLNKYFQFNPVFAKLYSYEKGTPRFFEFKISDFPINNKPKDEIDGYINLIFNEKLSAEEVAETSKLQKEAIIYCYFSNSMEIKNLLFEIEKIQRVIIENDEDKVAKRELENIVDSQMRLLNHYIINNIFYGGKDVKWFFNGETKTVLHKKDFNKLLSQVCHSVYHATPVFKNELVNKHRISASIHLAKRNYFKALANHWDEENLGFDDAKFPPEKTIYLTLLKENGISPIQDDPFNIPRVEKNSNIHSLWVASEKFIESAKLEQKSISEFVKILSNRPFKLKQGLIDFWIPTFLFLKREDFALFNESGYLPNISDENLELIAKYPQNYSIKTFDIEGVKLDVFNSYRIFLNQSTDYKLDNKTFIETIKPFIVFYKQLPDYSKNTKRLSHTALKIREAIVASKNPEETFFEAFPNALGITLDSLHQDKSKLQNYITNLQNAVRELRTSYDELIRRFEIFICNEFVGKSVEFEQYKSNLQERFGNLKRHLLLVNQKTFVQRIDSTLDDKRAWLNSIAQAVIGKTLEKFSDDDEILLYDRFKSMIIELDSLANLSKVDFDESSEDVVRIKIDAFFNGINTKTIRVPKQKGTEIDNVKAALKSALGKDKTSNIAAVLNLLKDLLQ